MLQKAVKLDGVLFQASKHICENLPVYLADPDPLLAGGIQTIGAFKAVTALHYLATDLSY
jgi:hypothetical protein